MRNKLWIISSLIGLVLGYLIGNLAPFRRPQTVLLDSGTYCCDRVDIHQKCIVKTGACPGDKPLTVTVP